MRDGEHFKIRRIAVVAIVGVTPRLLVPLRSESIPTTAANSIQFETVEQNRRSKLHTLSKIDPADKQARSVKLFGGPESILGPTQQNSSHDCGLDTNAQTNQPTPPSRSSFCKFRSNRRSILVVCSPRHRDL